MLEIIKKDARGFYSHEREIKRRESPCSCNDFTACIGSSLLTGWSRLGEKVKCSMMMSFHLNYWTQTCSSVHNGTLRWTWWWCGTPLNCTPVPARLTPVPDLTALMLQCLMESLFRKADSNVGEGGWIACDWSSVQIFLLYNLEHGIISDDLLMVYPTHSLSLSHSQ